MSELGLRFSLFVTRESGVVLSDCLDILLVACVLYVLLVLLKDTGTTRIGIGAALLFGLWNSAKWLDLLTLHATLTSLLTPLLVLAVLISQHDFRRGVQRFYRRPFLSSSRTAVDSQLIDDVVSSANSLALKRIGALIVLERRVPLDQIVEAGTTLDALVSKELLYSVFIPTHENPFHDGAVVIRDRHVWRAGAFLPLSVNSKLDRNLGTRHRAAPGISEESDAVVIVVSEERGEVSVCVDGIIIRNLEATLLRRILIGLFSRQRSLKPRASRDIQAWVARGASESSVPELRKPGVEAP
ncbi:MAG TPA: DNA integrity scanning protein DisA nucleotide-binding domain protein [Polyangiales bacterium]|nr:DNA integrity scanning protein DisA nucleotide-binding domain protein [Polyangiales bacterium]